MKFKIKTFLFPLRYIDLFQQNISFKIKNKYRVSLIIGRLLSIGIIFFILYNAINSDMISKTNPIVLQQSLKAKTRPNIYLNSDNFIFGFGISDEYFYHPADPTILFFELNLISYENGIYSKNIIDFEPCYKTSMKLSYLINDLNLTEIYCMKALNFNLMGYWDEAKMNYLSVELKKCVNNSETVICKSEEEINDFFKGKFLNFFLNQHQIDIKNFENPISTSLKIYFTGLDLGRRKEVSVYSKKTKILTDSQIIFQSYDEIETHVIDEVSMDSSISDESLLSFNIYSSDYILVYDRRYEKLFNLLASVGGILNPLLLIGSIIIKYLNDWRINELIMNKIYALDNKEIKKNNGKKIFRKENIYSKPTNCLKFSFWEKIKYLLTKKKFFSQKEVIYHDYLKKSNEKLDLFRLLKKLEEIDRIKLVIFNSNQRILFDYFTKLLISKKKMNKFRCDEKKWNEQINKKVLENIQQIKQSKTHSTIDKNLLQIIDGVHEIKKNCLYYN